MLFADWLRAGHTDLSASVQPATSLRGAGGVASVMAPASLGHSGQEALFAFAKNGVLAAFGEDEATVSEESLGEHKEHFIHGDALFIAAVGSTTGDGDDTTATTFQTAFTYGGHCLVRLLETDTGDRVVHVLGIVTAPSARGRGIARDILTAAVRELSPILVTARTQNPIVVRLFAGLGVPVFPEAFPAREEAYIRAAALTVATQIGSDLEKYDADALVYRAVYSPTRRAILGGGSSITSPAGTASVLDRLIDAEAGDAVLLVAALNAKPEGSCC